MTAMTGPAGPDEATRRGGRMKRLCATVLIMEAVVIWLAIPVALAVDHASPRRAGVAGVVLAVAAVALAALARRRLRWTLIGGSVLQAVVIAAGVIVPVMYFLGAIFAALWVIGILLGRRYDPGPLARRAEPGSRSGGL
jgi:hypothetical protein